MKTRRAYTIVELLMVVSVISILLTLIFKGVSGSMADARARRTEALCHLVQSGLAAYNAQYGKWPSALQGHVDSGSFPGPNTEGISGKDDPEVYVLKDDEVRSMVKALVDEAKSGNALLDISGLFVSRDRGERDGRGFGLDFVSAIRGTTRSRRKMSTSEMYFGYPEASSGHFRRFKMVYSIATDVLTVTTQN